MCPGPRDRPRRCLPVHRRPFMPATRTAFGRPRRAAGGWSASPLLSSHRGTQRAPPPQAPNALPLASHATLALTSAAGPGRAVEADKQRPSALRAFVERSQRPSAFCAAVYSAAAGTRAISHSRKSCWAWQAGQDLRRVSYLAAADMASRISSPWPSLMTMRRNLTSAATRQSAELTSSTPDQPEHVQDWIRGIVSIG